MKIKTLACLFALLASTTIFADTYSGTYGDNLSWSISTDDSTLVISGTGAIPYESYSSPFPWNQYRQMVKHITIDNGITGIGSGVFDSYDQLLSVELSNSVTFIDSYAFKNCNNMTSISIGTGLTDTGERVFSGCNSLSAVYISDIAAWCSIDFMDDSSNPLYYAHNLYWNGELVTDLVVPDSVVAIENHVFERCSSLTSVTIPNGVTKIGAAAFGDCSNLSSVTIPSSVTYVGEEAFYGCIGLAAVHIADLIAWCTTTFDYFFGCLSNPLYYAHNLYLNGEIVTDLVVPDSITSIGDCAFYACNSLTSVTIPNSVTEIGAAAFYGCTGLISVTCNAVIPPICEDLSFFNMNVFEGVDKSIPLYVPAASVDAYQAADQWCEFTSIIPMDDASTALDQLSQQHRDTQKRIQNNQILILRGDKNYTLTGQGVK